MRKPPPSDTHRWRLLAVRYGLGLVPTIIGVVLLIVNPGGFGVDGFGLGAGAGLSVILFNWLFRLGIEGDRERERHAEDTRYMLEHGHWPDEKPRPRG
jgi:hypothetical protein